MADKSGLPVKEVERRWKETKDWMADSPKGKKLVNKKSDAHYAYRMGALKKSLSLESQNLRDYVLTEATAKHKKASLWRRINDSRAAKRLAAIARVNYKISQGEDPFS